MTGICMLVTSDLARDPRVQKEARLAHESGFGVTVICRAHSGEPMPYEVVPLDVARGTSRLRKYAERLHLNWRMVREVVKRKPAIVHSNDLDTLPAGFVGARLSGASLVYDAHELWSDAARDVGALGAVLARRAESFLARRAAAVVTVSPYRGEAMARILGIPPPVVVMNTPFLEATDNAEPWEWRRDLEGRRVVLFQGIYSAGRGLEDAIRAARFFPTDVVLALRGFGAIEDQLRALAREERLDDRVCFLPPVAMNDLVRSAVGADLGLVCYDPVNENNRLAAPNKMFEYLMAGVPCVGTDLPYIRDVLCGQGVGGVYRAGDPEDLARVVADLLADGDQLAAMGRRCRQAVRRFCWEVEGAKLIREYERLVAQGVASLQPA